MSASAYYERDLYGPINEIHEAAALYSYGTEDEYLAANGLTPDIYDIPAQYRLQHWRKMYGFRQDSYEFEQTEEAQREELIRKIDASVKSMSLRELEALYYELSTKNYISERQ